MPVIVRKAKSLIRYRQRRDRILPFSAAAPGGPIALVQSVSKIANAVNNTTLAFPSPVTAGNFIAVTQASFRSGGNVIQTPTDTLGHTYVPMTDQNGSSVNIALRSYYVANISGGSNTVTFAMDGAGTGEISAVIAEFSGVATSSSLDDSNLLTGGSGTSPSTGDVTPSVSGCLLYAGMTLTQNDIAVTEEAGWARLQQRVQASILTVSTSWKIGTTSAEDADWTLFSGSAWAAHIAAFLPAAGAAGILRQMMSHHGG